jgi:hypothetical protein
VKIRLRSSREVVVRASQLLRARAEGIGIYRRWLSARPLCATGHTEERLFDALTDRITGELRQHEALSPNTLTVADDALRGRFAIFDLQGIDLGFPPTWHMDPKHGKTSPLVPWRQLDSLDEGVTGNKKYVWELNRHHFVTELARAYSHTSDERYADGVVRALTDWIDRNPVGLGINWVSSLELGFRCINWLWALALIKPSTAWSAAPQARIAKSIDAQTRHVERFLSTYSSPNTHLTGEALALYGVGVGMPGLARAARWRQLGKSILLRELGRQVRADGGYFEQSTWYHRYTAEFYLQFLGLARRAGDEVPGAARHGIESLLNALRWLMRPDGTWPRFGDDDGGTLLPFGAGRGDDWRELFQFAAALGVEPAIPTSLDRAFSESGWFVMRSGWDSAASTLLLDAGPHGVMNCGHAHADALAIELTYSEGNPARNEFRSSPAHNTVEVDGLSSSTPAPRPFQWKSRADAGCTRWISEEAFAFFEGWQDGYTRLEDPVSHARSVLFVGREYWVVLDHLQATTPHDFRVHYHWDPRVTVMPGTDGRSVRGVHADAALNLVYPFSGGQWHVQPERHSPGFGREVSATDSMYCSRGSEARLLCLLFPGKAGTPPPQVHCLAASDGLGLEVRTEARTDTIFWRTSRPGADGLVFSDFEWLWSNSRPASRDTGNIVAIGGRHLDGGTFSITAESPMEFLMIARRGEELDVIARSADSCELVVGQEIRRVLVNGVGQGIPADRHIKITRANGGR